MGYPFDLGSYSRKVSTRIKAAQTWFNRGLAMCYGYNHDEAVRKLVISELEPQLLHAGRLLSETPPFPWSRATLQASKSISNLVPCANEFEKEFAQFLEKASDVQRFAKLPERAGRFVDLHAVVRRALRASVERYSIKDLEPFYSRSMVSIVPKSVLV